ncbi:MAG TPA: FecR family protein [Spirochaetia bacterium]|nr:FecR family protein [Spirochaetia bacterium]
MLPRRAGARLIGLLGLLLFNTLPLFSQAELVYEQGTVTVRRGNSTLTPDMGTALEQGDLVSTGPAATAVIRLNATTEVKMREQTDFRIENLGTDTTLNLERGGLFSSIVGKLQGRFSVRTGTVVAGVRGTEFFVAYGKTVDKAPDIWLCVNRGTVAVSVEGSKQEVDVPAGKGINVLAGLKITPPKQYAWTRKLNWNMDPNAAPVKDTTNLNQAYTDLLNQDYD